MMNLLNFDIEMVFCILSGKVSTAINRRMYRRFRKENIDITPEQWSVLHYLWSKDGVTQQELCNATFKDKPSMTRLIDNIEKQGLVTRSSDRNDRRINLINLTDQGRKMEEATQPLVSSTMKEALSGLSEEEVQTAQLLLNKVFNNIKGSLSE